MAVKRMGWSRVGIRSRATVAVLAGMTIVLVALFGFLLGEERDLDRGFAAFDVARASIEMDRTLRAGGDPSSVTADAPDHTVVIIAQGSEEFYRFGDSDMIADLEGVRVLPGEVRGVRLAGRNVVLYDASCPLPDTDDCDFRLAVPRRSVSRIAGTMWSGYLKVVLPILALAAISVPLLVGRSLRAIGLLSSEVDSITDTRQLHQIPLPEANDEIRRLTETLNGLLARLHEANRAQRRIIADASHELRSPVAAIGVTTDMANRFPERRSSDTTWERPTAESARLNRVVEQLLIVASTEQVTGESRRVEPVDLEAVVRSQLPVDSDIEIRVDRVGEPFAMTTITDAEIMISNLINNGVRHAIGSLDVEIHPASDHRIAVEVSDDGGGISPAHHELVFEPFTRLDAARSQQTGGTGLGLTIARTIARSCGGDIYFDPGQRSTVVCILPRPAEIGDDELGEGWLRGPSAL